uniref:Dynein attachment factor N-terminal domain-containing protein n=1 Tax=Proboscia inermis TaxID=420281 RepID=A0A7S0CGE9_9STRA|mmetsp:Transcript_47031/g.47478  ORF Transcript_47031/g.47478 Transcript_47031/m.47478 type:complete len:349 (+) Transcript_47031:123-1169(+)
MTFNNEQHKQSAILPDGSLDLDFMKREIERDFSNERQYRAEDEMKKRAVHSSKNYDEFQAFVSCSELKPLQTREVAQLINPKYCGRVDVDSARTKQGKSSKSKVHGRQLDQMHHLVMGNIICDDSGKNTVMKLNRKVKKDCIQEKVEGKYNAKNPLSSGRHQKPKNCTDFENQWRKLRNINTSYSIMKPSKRLDYLTSIVTSLHFQNVLYKGKKSKPIDPTIMEEILNELYYYSLSIENWFSQKERKSFDNSKGIFQSQHDLNSFRFKENDFKEKIVKVNVLVEWLFALSKCERFTLNLCFLGKQTKEFVRCMIQWIVSEIKVMDAEATEKLKETVQFLECLYTSANE